MRAVCGVNSVSTLVDITHELEKPNGIILSPDERSLSVGDHNNGSDGLDVDQNAPPPRKGAMKVYAFPLDKDGLVSGPRRTLVDIGKEAGCDGITADSKGTVYLTCRRLAQPGPKVTTPSARALAFLPTGP